tara:strand:- start:460 stop:912 length:453 start_codon:yes stop_codon:yes gene_type:complete
MAIKHSQEFIDLLSKLWSEGKSSAQISRHPDVMKLYKDNNIENKSPTRNIIIGVLYRNNGAFKKGTGTFTNNSFDTTSYNYEKKSFNKLEKDLKEKRLKKKLERNEKKYRERKCLKCNEKSIMEKNIYMCDNCKSSHRYYGAVDSFTIHL